MSVWTKLVCQCCKSFYFTNGTEFSFVNLLFMKFVLLMFEVWIISCLVCFKLLTAGEVLCCCWPLILSTLLSLAFECHLIDSLLGFIGKVVLLTYFCLCWKVYLKKRPFSCFDLLYTLMYKFCYQRNWWLIKV